MARLQSPLRKNDNVVVTAGKDSGKRGRVLRVVTDKNRVIVEGVAEDGTIEAISIDGAPGFALGVQWHAEYDPQTNFINRTLFKAFGTALRQKRKAA